MAIKKLPPFNTSDKIILNFKIGCLYFYTGEIIDSKTKWVPYKQYRFKFTPQTENSLSSGNTINLECISCITNKNILFPIKLYFDEYIKIKIDEVFVNLRTNRCKYYQKPPTLKKTRKRNKK